MPQEKTNKSGTHVSLSRPPFDGDQTIVKRALWEATKLALPYINGRVLDVGCGDKPYQLLLGETADSWLGLDNAGTVRDRHGADIFGDAQRLPFTDESFETVFCSQVLEHVPDPQKVICEASRVLVRGGHLILTAPQSWPLHEEPNDFYRYTPYGLKTLVSNAGLVASWQRPYGGTLAHLAQAAALHFKISRLLPRFAVAGLAAIVLRADRRWFRTGDALGNLIIARKP